MLGLRSLNLRRLPSGASISAELLFKETASDRKSIFSATASLLLVSFLYAPYELAYKPHFFEISRLHALSRSSFCTVGLAGPSC